MRGYGYISNEEGIVKSVGNLKLDEKFTVTMFDGKINAIVKGKEKMNLEEKIAKLDELATEIENGAPLEESLVVRTKRRYCRRLYENFKRLQRKIGCFAGKSEEIDG